MRGSNGGGGCLRVGGGAMMRGGWRRRGVLEASVYAWRRGLVRRGADADYCAGGGDEAMGDRVGGLDVVLGRESRPRVGRAKASALHGDTLSRLSQRAG
jgi:hypothetical protein